METNFDINLFHLMVLGLGIFFYATFPVERYSKWVEKTFGAWLDKVIK
jgi:hypothetical protein